MKVDIAEILIGNEIKGLERAVGGDVLRGRLSGHKKGCSNGESKGGEGFANHRTVPKSVSKPEQYRDLFC